jgi:hypothetical protein
MKNTFICNNCRWWDVHTGECHRYPPRVFIYQTSQGLNAGSHLHFTPSDGFCGEFRADEEPQNPDYEDFQRNEPRD